MKKILLSFFFLLCAAPNFLHAEDGDVETIRVHDKVDMTWYQGYEVTGNFPDGSKTYENIYLHYTMGCASTGCSDWDYTSRIELMMPTGVMDSSVLALDTLSSGPYVVDTTWNVFEVREPFELGRVITPYGGYMATGAFGYDNDWEQTFTFDITDFAPFLKNEVDVRAFYEGWSSGFSATLDFQFVEGTPKRTVKSIENIYRGGFNYSDSQTFEDNSLPQKPINIAEDVGSAKVRVIPTGHGFDNNVNCAEFCERSYYIKIGGQQRFSQPIWDDECGNNPIYPQAGTWVYDRANWCPGKEAKVFEHDITPYISSGVNLFDMDVQSYNWSGTQAPSYIISCQLITYEQAAVAVDATISHILAPSKETAFSRMNPICDEPLIEIQNRGSENLTKCLIQYGVIYFEGIGSTCYYEWEGDLATFESEQISLPYPVQWFSIPETDALFYAEIVEIEDCNDDYTANNRKESLFDATPRHDEPLRIRVTPNLASTAENTLRVFNENGDVILEESNFPTGSNYDFDLTDLSDGCYSIQFEDTGGDGLSFFGNNDGNGSFRILNVSGGVVKDYNANFGSKLTYNFTVGYTMGGRIETEFCPDVPNPNAAEDCTQIAENTTAIATTNGVEIYPNPTEGELFIDLKNKQAGIYNIFDVQGKLLQTNVLSANSNRIQLNLENGLYFVQVKIAGQTIATEAVTILK